MHRRREEVVVHLRAEDEAEPALRLEAMLHHQGHHVHLDSIITPVSGLQKNRTPLAITYIFYFSDAPSLGWAIGCFPIRTPPLGGLTKTMSPNMLYTPPLPKSSHSTPQTAGERLNARKTGLCLCRPKRCRTRSRRGRSSLAAGR